MKVVAKKEEACVLVLAHLTSSNLSLAVQPARLDLDIQSTPAIQGSQVQVSRPSFEIFSAKAAKLEVSTRAIQSELGFRRPKQLAEEGKRLAKSEAQSAVSRITSEGDQYLNSPQNATTSIASY